MNTRTQRLPMLLMAMAALILAATAPLGWADDDIEIPFDVGKLFFQLNDTDEDLGIHAIIDGEPWKKLTIDAPNDRLLLDITTRSRLRRQGLTELRFESAEPSFDELSAEAFFRRFPEGEYDIEGRTLEGEERESTIMITHVMPAPPENLLVSGVGAPEDCDEDPVPAVAPPIDISWDPVIQSHPDVGESGPIDIVRYEVAVEREAPALIVTADVPPSITSFQVPPGLLATGQEIKFQILATDAGGNETSSESCFVVM